MDGLNNIYFPICALLISMLVSIIYFNKKRVDNKETRIYKNLVIINLMESITACTIVTLALLNSNLTLLVIFNKIDYLLIFYWIWLLFYYVYSINFKKNSPIKSSILINLFITILILVTPITIVNKDGIMNSYGLSNSILFSSVAVYLVLIIGIVIYGSIKDINNGKKYIPMSTLIIFIIAMMIIRIIRPEVNLLAFVMSFINLIMYFTIENPDIRMINALENAKDQADKANRAKTDFLSSMSHEIRTPLNAIMGFSDCINNSNTLEEAKENAKDIINASSALLEIVNGILDISKIEAGKLEIVNSPYNARSTFEELAKLIKPKMQEKGLDFSYYIAPDLPKTLYGDHANIRKVVTNLLSNAAKYTDKGFVRYEVNCINTENVSKIIISVEDSGRGIKQENIDKLFTKFQRLDEDKNTTIEGTGLGLAITKQLTELMGGKIIVHTVYGEGSKFTVVLNQPIEKKEVKVVEETSNTTLDLTGVKILIVDDNTLNLKVATKLLERYKADSITCVESGFICLDKIGNGEKYDVILMDDMMPKMSGVETLRKLKENRHFKTPVIALTANAITGMKEKYLSEGFNEYLAKPIEKDDLIRVMNLVLKNETSSETETETDNFKKNDELKQEELNTETLVEQKEQTEHLIEENTENKQEEKSLFSFLKHEKEDKKEEVDKEVIPVEENIESILENTQKLTPLTETSSEEINELQENNKEESNTSEKDLSKYAEKEKFLRKKGIDLDKALELLGDMEMYDATLKDFYDTADTKWLKIRSYKNTKDLENYSIEVHSLKSDAKYLGFMELANMAYEHELKSKEKDEIFVNNHFNDLEYEYNKIMSMIDEYNSLNEDRFTVMDLPH